MRVEKPSGHRRSVLSGIILAGLLAAPAIPGLAGAAAGASGSAPAAAAAAAAATDGAVMDLGWLAGCWMPEGGEDGSVEQWTAPAGGTMLGVNRTVKDGKTVAYEFVQIRATEGGEVEYVARPSGQQGAAFTMVRQGEGEVVFENLEHDFPQRIIYRLEAGGRLSASIEGEVDGELQGVAFPMRRMACP